jgi:membrane-associated phospholipid phosphatase
MRTIMQSLKSFLVPYFLLLLVVTLILAFIPKAQIHIAVNQLNTPLLDHFFKYATYFGDGVVIIPVICLFLLISFRKFFIAICSFLASGLLVQLLKRLVFSDAVRPSRYFQGIYELHLVDGVKMYSNNSFPSGHSASAFAFFICLAYFSKNRLIQALCLVAAILVAYSRMYLSQHFLADIYTGSIIGTSLTLLFIFWFNKLPQWADKSLFNLRK